MIVEIIKTVDYNKDIIKQNNEIAQGELGDASEILERST